MYIYTVKWLENAMGGGKCESRIVIILDDELTTEQLLKVWRIMYPKVQPLATPVCNQIDKPF